MKRRSFVKASIMTGAAASMLPATSRAASSRKSNTEFYELRVYTFKNDVQQKLVEDYFQNAAIPAYNRLGSKNIGVFTELKPEASLNKLYVLIPYTSLDEFLTIQNKLTADADYNAKASAYLSAPMAAPAYDRIESSLLQAFTGMPKMEVPAKTARIFELRRYESPTEAAGKSKIAMFNEAGEIGIFKRLNFKPVFYSETLIGEVRPNLVYMVTFDDMDAHDKIWKAFGADADWIRIKSMPEYPDSLVSRITSTFLIPSAYSQV